MTALMGRLSKPFMMTPRAYGPAAYVAPSWFSTRIDDPCANAGSGRESFDNPAGAGGKTKAELDVPEQPRIELFCGPDMALTPDPCLFEPCCWPKTAPVRPLPTSGQSAK